METHVEKQGEHLNANSNTCNDSTIHLYNCFKILKRYILLSKERHESKVACSQAVSQQQKK
jgi:predicted methyltransferase